MIAIIQARMSSERLPNKVLKNCLEKTILERTHKQVQKSKLINSIVIATSLNHEDDEINNFCSLMNYDCFRGNLIDVS